MPPDEQWVRAERESLRGRLVAAGLERVAATVAGLGLPSVRLRPVDGEGVPDGTSPGNTRLAGRPDLPPGETWPEDPDGRPLPFLAQLDLAELAPHDHTGALPAAGTLTFFYDLLDQPWGYDPRHAGRWAVRHTGPGVRLTPRDAPEGPPRDAAFAGQRLAPQAELAPPDVWTDPAIEALQLTRAERSQLEAVLGAGDSGLVHRVLGHPLSVQGPMALECQLASNGVFAGDGSYERHPRFEELQDGARDWRLLLQLDSDEDHCWGDIGRLYFWIRDQDLRAGAWERVWLVLQCT